MPTALFWVETTGEVELSLRRFTFGTDASCPATTYGHTASRKIGRAKERRTSEGMLDVVPVEEFRTRRWPSPCENCGGFFRDAHRQVNQEPIYRSAAGEEWTMVDLPPGACFDAAWLPEGWKSPEGVGLTVRLPEGVPRESGDARSKFWHPYSEATGGGHWEVTWPTGPPDVSTLQASPSIASGQAGQPGYYHGWLGSNGAEPGYLSDHIG